MVRTAVFDNLNALLTSEAAGQGPEILYTVPHGNDVDDQTLFRRLEAIHAFFWALPIGDC